MVRSHWATVRMLIAGCAYLLLAQVRELDLATLRWRKVETKGIAPPYRIHCSAGVVGDKWIIHGGRRPGKFNVTNQTFVFDFSCNRCGISL